MRDTADQLNWMRRVKTRRQNLPESQPTQRPGPPVLGQLIQSDGADCTIGVGQRDGRRNDGGSSPDDRAAWNRCDMRELQDAGWCAGRNSVIDMGGARLTGRWRAGFLPMLEATTIG